MANGNSKFINYFTVDGVKYYTGTVFIMKRGNADQTEATFICYNTETNMFCYQPHNSKCNKHWANQQMFQDWFVCVTDKVDDRFHAPVEKTRSDSQINGLLTGWLWYICLMVLAACFKENIGLWIFISVVFFNWRNKKIKTEGTYYEW